jgi:hypothetical protein
MFLAPTRRLRPLLLFDVRSESIAGAVGGAPYPDGGYAAVNLSQSWVAFKSSGQSNNNQSKVKNLNGINTNVKLFNTDISGSTRINAWENSEHSSHAKTGADLIAALSRSASWEFYFYKGGTEILEWTKSTDSLFELEQTLEAEAIAEASQSGLYPMFGIWYQIEADISPAKVPLYPAKYAKHLDNWRNEYGYIWVLQVQLAPIQKQPNAGWGEPAREMQRQLETGAGFAISQNRNRLVMAHDLSHYGRFANEGEVYHLGSYAKQELGKRLGLAARQDVFGQSIDGMGPRISSVVRVSNTTIDVTFDRAITSPLTTDATAYDSYFKVKTASGSTLTISSITRPTTTKVTIIHTSESGSIVLSYQPPMLVQTTFDPATPFAYPNCIRGVTADALPTPAFTIPLS